MYERPQAHLQWLADSGGEHQARTVTKLHILGEENGLEVLGVSWSFAHTDHLT